MLGSLTVQPACHWVTNDRFPPSLIPSSPPCSCSCGFWGSKRPGNTSSTADRLLKLAYRQRPNKGSTFFSFFYFFARLRDSLIMHIMRSDWESDMHGLVWKISLKKVKASLKSIVCSLGHDEETRIGFPDYWEDNYLVIGIFFPSRILFTQKKFSARYYVPSCPTMISFMLFHKGTIQASVQSLGIFKQTR